MSYSWKLTPSRGNASCTVPRSVQRYFVFVSGICFTQQTLLDCHSPTSTRFSLGHPGNRGCIHYSLSYHCLYLMKLPIRGRARKTRCGCVCSQKESKRFIHLSDRPSWIRANLYLQITLPSSYLFSPAPAETICIFKVSNRYNFLCCEG